MKKTFAGFGWCTFWIFVSVVCFGTYPGWKALFVWMMVRCHQNVGDADTALSAIFTLAAFVGVVITLHFQQRDLKDQGKELSEQRRLTTVQNAKADFFRLLETWQEVVHQVTYDNCGPGSNSLQSLAGKLDNAMTGGRTDRKPLSLEKAQNLYESAHQDFLANSLNHYYRLLYQIVRYLKEETAFDANERQRLVRIVRATISEPQFVLIFWNSISNHAEKFAPLIDEFDLLQNFSYRNVLPEERRLYRDAYQRRQGR